MIPVMGLSLVSVECHGFYNKPIEIFKISGITLLGGLLCNLLYSLEICKFSEGKSLHPPLIRPQDVHPAAPFIDQAFDAFFLFAETL